jgi:hypothetical protein
MINDILMAAAGASNAVVTTYVDDVFSTYTYTGNGVARNIVNNISLGSGFTGTTQITKTMTRAASAKYAKTGSNLLYMGQNSSSSLYEVYTSVNTGTSWTSRSAGSGTGRGVEIGLGYYMLQEATNYRVVQIRVLLGELLEMKPQLG